MNDPVSISKIGNLLGVGSFGSWDSLMSGKVIPLINMAIGFSALVAVILLIIAGYTYMTSAGDADKVEKAGKTITGTIIGLIIVFLAGLLVKTILNAIGVE